jgi:hypothetical protein
MPIPSLVSFSDLVISYHLTFLSLTIPRRRELQIFRLEEKLRDAMTGRPVTHDFATAAQSSTERRQAERLQDLENRNQKLEIADLQKRLEASSKALAESQGVVSDLHVSRRSIFFTHTTTFLFHFLISSLLHTGRQQSPDVADISTEKAG